MHAPVPFTETNGLRAMTPVAERLLRQFADLEQYPAEDLDGEVSCSCGDPAWWLVLGFDEQGTYSMKVCHERVRQIGHFQSRERLRSRRSA